MFKINKNLFYFINLLILTSYFFGFILKKILLVEGKAIIIILLIIMIVFSNEIQNIDWLKYSRQDCLYIIF